jgi:hypothetical protein
VSVNNTAPNFYGGYFWGHNCLAGLDFVQVFGKERCHDGAHHDECSATPFSSRPGVYANNDDRAFCRARWQNPSDPNNCLCEVHVQVPTNCNGGLACNVTVTERPTMTPPPGCPAP